MSDAREPAGNDPPPLLLLADDEAAREISRRMERPDVVRSDDAYDALLELARRRCGAVVMTAPRPELDGFARAVRRLNRQVRLLAVCPPDAPPEARAEVERLADGCCSYPPTRGELNVLLRAPAGVGQALPFEAQAPAALSIGEIAALVEATRSVEELEARLAQMVSAAAGATMHWVSVPECGTKEPLLMRDAEPPRVLVAETPIRFGPAVDALLADLHILLPALNAAAGRTESLHRLAITDHLTGAYNRRYFYHLTDHILRRAEEEHFRATLLLYDIDNFKRYNDEYGHAAGDDILRDTAALMRSICREQDIVARIGGDEFAVLFWDHELRRPDSQPLQDAWDLADRFRRAVADQNLRSLGPHAAGELTISGGLATFPEHGSSCRDLLRQADRALRTAKASGKNSIRLIGA